MHFYVKNVRFLLHLLQDLRILDPGVLRKQQDLRQDLRSLGVLVHKGEEDAPALLRVDRDDGQHGISDLVHDTAPKVHAVLAEFAVDQRVIPVDTDIVRAKQARLHSTIARRISMVEWLVSGSTPPAYATLTARSTSRITSL